MLRTSLAAIAAAWAVAGFAQAGPQGNDPAPEPPAAPAVEAPAPAAAAAATPAPPRKHIAAGDRELGFGLDFSKDDTEGSKTDYLSVDLRYGYLTSDVNEFGLQASYAKIDGDGFSTDTYLFGPFYTYNVPSAGDTVPFVGALFAVTSTDLGFGKLDGQVIEFTGGVRIFAGADFAVNVGAYYRESKLDFEGIDVDETTFGLRAVLSGFLR